MVHATNTGEIRSDLYRSDIFINGSFQRAASTGRVSLINPASEEQIGEVVDSSDEDVDRAVSAARAALGAWSRTTVTERGAVLRRIADGFERRMDEITALVTLQNGSVITRSKSSNGVLPLASYRYHSQLAESFEEDSEVVMPTAHSYVRWSPIGVVGAIVPWNAPQGLLAYKLAPALLAGCTVVAKPSPETSLDALLLGEILDEAGVPPGVVNIVTGGPRTGAALVDHPGTDMISFTGSTTAGRAVASTCGRQLKKVSAELGGKSAAIVLEEADLDLFARLMIDTCLPNTGQVCYSCTRLLAPRRQFDDIVDLVVSTLRAAPAGDPTNPESRFGPLVTARQRDRVEAYIESGRSEGAHVVLGGGRPADHLVGYYVEPTVFVDVGHTMRIFREEIFGPVLVVVPFDGDEEAVRIANDSSYGLGGSVFSRDIDRAKRIGSQIQTGSVSVNGALQAPGTPTSAQKDSGVGQPDKLGSFLQATAVALPLQ